MSLLTPKARHKMMEDAGWCCRNCGRGGRLTIDHIIPVSRGGSNAQANLRVLCAECNQRKADKMPGDDDLEIVRSLTVRCQRCCGRGVLDKPFGRKCATCSGTGRLSGDRSQRKLSKRQRRLQGVA